MKSCCDEMCMNHGCNQGDNCPARQTMHRDKLDTGLGVVLLILGVLAWAMFYMAVTA